MSPPLSSTTLFSILSKSSFSNLSYPLPLTCTSFFSLRPADHRLPALPWAPIFRAFAERGSGPHERWTGGPCCGGPGTCAAAQVTTPPPPHLSPLSDSPSCPLPCSPHRRPEGGPQPLMHPQEPAGAEGERDYEIHTPGGDKGCVSVLG